MALSVLAQPNVPITDPTISLKQALLNFEEILSDEQKRQYQASAAKPDATSVITFVTHVDANNNSTARRCVAPILCTFLEATQQFTGVVDTFVSSNPTIAALIWGGVKTTILAASNVMSYFDKVTSMIMMIGNSSPTFQQFGQLYPGCMGLQRALCDYYAIIVRLCTKIIEVSRRTPITQTLSSIFNPFESEFKVFLSDLDYAVKAIHLQLILASEQATQETKMLLEHERRENANFRRRALSFQRKASNESDEAQQWRIRQMQRDTAKLKLSIRNNLSNVDHVKPWKQAMKERVPGTADWLKQEPQFQEWKDNRQGAILWCSGTMGVGKTILLSNVVAHLHTSRKFNDVIAHYFCRADHKASLTARSIFGSLARQLLDAQIEHAENHSMQDLHKDSQNLLDADEVLDFLLSRLPANMTYYVVLDGLDECESSEIRKVVQSMARICNQRVKIFKILCASRPELEKQFFGMMKPNYTIAMSEDKIESDMDHYIATTLDRCLEVQQLKLRDPRLIVKISQALQRGSDGMFLWTRFVIEELCEQATDDEILEALYHIPRGLSEMFDRKLGRVMDGAGVKEAMKMLQFCGVVKRPLTTIEYQEALSISPGTQKSFDHGKLPNDMDRIVRDCRGLIFVDEEESTVHYVHHSVKQHLFATTGLKHAKFNEASADQDFGFLCMTYLDFTDFKRQLTKFRKGSRTMIKPIELGLISITGKSRTGSRVAQKLLRHRRHLQHLSAQELERKAQEILGDAESSRLELELQSQQFQLLDYARIYWIYHLTQLDADTDNQIWRLFCRCVQGHDTPAHRPWISERQASSGRNDATEMLEWLLLCGNHALLMYLVAYHSASLTKERRIKIFENAAINDRYLFIRTIGQLSDNTRAVLDHGLFCAARYGRMTSIASLLCAGADANARVEYETALQAAAKEGHLEVVERLLAAKADVNAPAAGHQGRTALQAAAGEAHLEVVEKLLAAGADVNALAAYSQGRTALQAAAGEAHLEVVERLLAAKANVNAPAADYAGRTALQAAAGGGHLEVVERLLAAKADVNAPAVDYAGRTALQAAAEGGHLEVVERLKLAAAGR